MNSALAHLDRIVRPAGHVFFGWWIVLASGGIQFLSGILWMQSYGAYVVLLQDDFGWSKALVAGAFALTRIESGILGPLQGYLVDRLGPKLILRIGMVLFGLGFIAFSRIDSILGFYLSFAMIAVGSSLGGFATVMVSIVNWFEKHRAKAIAVSQMGYSVGGLSVPVIILCLEAFGWRTTAVLSGIFVLVVGLPLCELVRHKPGPYGEQVDGGTPQRETADAAQQERPRSTRPAVADFTAREAMRTPAFWLISLGHSSALFVVSTVMVHLVAHLSEGLGYSLTGAGLVVALMTGFQMLGQIGGGFLGDRFNKRMICILCMIAHALGLVLVAYAGNGLMVLAFAALHGLAWGIRGPLMVALRADYFGPSAFGTIMGFSSLIVMLGMSGGPIITGYLADVGGDYIFGFSLMAAIALAGSLCFLLATPPHPPRRPA